MDTPNTPKMYRIKITLNDTHPPIWRRFLVEDISTLLDLHAVIQVLFDWNDCHLHEFRVKEARYGDPANDEFELFDIQNETTKKLRDLNLVEGSRFTYAYDFGDSWELTLLVEKVLPIDKSLRPPLCLKGKRAAPPEDVGGVWGYAGFLEAIADPDHQEHESYLEWVGGAFDPEAFDLAVINARLPQPSRRKWRGDLSEPAGVDEPTRLVIFNPDLFEKLYSPQGQQAAQALPLRQDIVALLSYLRENKVIGTKTTGNFPRKPVKEIAALFVTPPILETKIGNTFYRFQSETDVWPVYFAHELAQGAKLLEGGPNRRWRLSPPGLAFLDLPPEVQVWTLFDAWWHKVNWLIAFPDSVFGDYLPEDLSSAVLGLLRKLPTGRPFSFEDFAGQVVVAAGLSWEKREPDLTKIDVYNSIEQMVIEPLEGFGVLTTEREKDPQHKLLDIRKLVTFTLTDFGQALLETV